MTVAGAVMVLGAATFVWLAHAMARVHLDVSARAVWVVPMWGRPRNVELSEITTLEPSVGQNYGGIVAALSHAPWDGPGPTGPVITCDEGGGRGNGGVRIDRGLRATARPRRRRNNRRLLVHGLRMTSVFDYSGTDDAARAILEPGNDASYRYGFAPLQVRIVDGTSVLMHGPSYRDGDTVMRTRSAMVVEAALAYGRAVLATTRPCTPDPDREGCTPRQEQIITLLLQDVTDDRTATSLELSVRTVRYEIAEVVRRLGVRSRFAAGYAYGARRASKTRDSSAG